MTNQDATASSSTSSSVKVEIINDTGKGDGEVFLLLTAKSVTASGGITTLVVPPSASGTAGVLTGLTNDGSTVTSPYTGKVLPIYSFELTELTSGRILVSFDTAITYETTGAPTAESQNLRWDKIELGYPNSGVDLTSIDFFGIPMQFEYLDASGNVLGMKTFYNSTKTLLTSIYDLDTSTMSDAFQQVNTAKGATAPTTGWDPTTGSMSDFLRVLGPQTLSANSSGNSPAPYPSFKAYLDALVTAATTFTITGKNGVGAPAPQPNSVDFDYSGKVVSDGSGGYKVELTGTTTGTVYGLYTSGGAPVYMKLPANEPVTLALPKAQFDEYVYGAASSAFTVGSLTDDKAKASKNSAYANIANDFIAALNCGYAGGKYGDSSAAWFNNPPTPYPFGGARTTNDGYYNPFAAVFYNQSDSYGYPFSDRGGRPSPYLPQPTDATTIRITLLNDDRLDAPLVTAGTIEDTSIELKWSAITAPTGTTGLGYELSVTPAVSGYPKSLGAVESTTVDGLSAGTAYQFSLTATGTANGNAVSSHTLPVVIATSGTAPVLAGTLPFQVNLAPGASSLPSGAAVTLNGAAYTPGTSVAVKGASGVNAIPVIMTSTPGNYQGTLAIALTETSAGGVEVTVGGNPDPTVTTELSVTFNVSTASYTTETGQDPAKAAAHLQAKCKSTFNGVLDVGAVNGAKFALTYMSGQSGEVSVSPTANAQTILTSAALPPSYDLATPFELVGNTTPLAADPATGPYSSGSTELTASTTFAPQPGKQVNAVTVPSSS